MKKLLFIVALGLQVVGCGKPEVCNTAQCGGTSTKSYQACATEGSTQATYKYGGDTCTCDTSNQTECIACAGKVQSYCTAP